MPYVAMAPAVRGTRLAAATARWDAILALRPDLAPAVELQRHLLGVIGRLADTIEEGRFPRLSLPSNYLAAKLATGVPALSGEPIPLPVPLLKPALLELCEHLSRGGAGEAADHIRTALDETRMEAGSLLTASLKRDQAAIRTGAVHRGLAPDLLWLVAELAVSPFVYMLQQSLFSSAEPSSSLRSSTDAWRHGYCLSCGSWPVLAEVADGHRILRCSFCALAWELATHACVYCGHSGEKFVTAAPDGDRSDRRLEACGACGAYLKTADVAALSPFPLLAIADLETMELDTMAMEHGYARPPMKDFAKR
ncbi:MAG: formate dehydrogenase accessory protein FdhE [Luteitalea sp.]|nr:formate dehydrogenase accessory protein FdhE [Luteitalea sp.]